MNASVAAVAEDFGVVASLHELIALRARAGLSVPAVVRAHDAAPGAHAAPRRARGMEFAEVRLYQAGDDARSVDWRQTARRGRLYTKLYQEEHERPLRLLVDLGPSMRFGTRVAFKSVVGARAAALLAWNAAAAGDRVGGLAWSGGGERELPPQGRERGALALSQALAQASAAAPTPTLLLAQPLADLLRVPRPGSAVVLISDFAALDATAERRLAALAHSTELLLVHVHDVFEADPPPGRYRFSDGRRSVTLDLRSSAARADYTAAFAARRDALARLARRNAAVLLDLPTDGDLPALLAPALRRNGAHAS